VTTLSLGAWVLHALALWLWHLPILFQAALLHPLCTSCSTAAFSARASPIGGPSSAGARESDGDFDRIAVHDHAPHQRVWVRC
jgi:hypothetical protein